MNVQIRGNVNFEADKFKQMKKIIWVCGIIAGLISVSWGVLSENFLGGSVSYNMAVFCGYAAMVLGFSLIYIGVKSYRDNQNGGVITFSQALKISLLITAVASTVYVVIWVIDFYCFIPDFSRHFLDWTRAQMVAQHKSAAEIQKQLDDLATSLRDYRKPLKLVSMTYIEIVPVGIVVSLIASFILKNNNKPATVSA